MPLPVKQVISVNRCYLCREYPNAFNPVAVKVDLGNSGYNWTICASCVDEMHFVLHGKVQMSLKEQIKKLAAELINESFSAVFVVPALVKELAQRAFVYQWPESWKTKAIRRAWMLLNENPGYIADTELAEPEV